MGLLSRIGGGLVDVATSVIPGPLDDLAVAAGRELLGGRGGGSGSRPPAPTRGTSGSRRRTRSGGSGRASTTSIAPTGDPPSFGGFTPSLDFGPVEIGPGGPQRSPMNLGPLNLTPTDGGDETPAPTGGGGGFGGNLAMKLMMESVSSKTGRALMEAITSGSLQQGVIQRTRTVNTPRGTENHSPPGFRTVYVNDQPYAVFKPLAKSLGLLPSSGLTERQKLDKIARKYISAQSQYEDLAKKLGLKTSKRKSGPSR